MPKRTDIKKILIIGSGPIVIGQACEFDYSGAQACKALRSEGYEVVLVNSNPATIMTDPDMADVTYIEPLTVGTMEKIIKKERPQALLPTMGGQTALNLSVNLAEKGILEKYGVELIGANLEAIKKAEEREAFRKAMTHIGLECPKSVDVNSLEMGLKAIKNIGFPVILRPSFTLGGTGGGVAYNIEEYQEKLEKGLKLSPVQQVLVEESVIGWKEFELEVMRDTQDNVVIICSIENLDPMGIHTGDSITVAPAQTLTDKEYQRMRDAAIAIIREIGVDTGGSNIQFALNPQTGRMVVIEMNPRVSRSSALASKATGFPIAKIAAKLAVGLTLDEIPNDITRETPASFEPTLDYVVVKMPRFAFEKFPDANSTLTVQMKSVGEAMSIGRTFKEAFLKALRSLETDSFGLTEIKTTKEEIIEKLRLCHPERIWYVAQAIRQGFTMEEIFDLTFIDPWFLNNIQELIELEDTLKSMVQGKSDKEETLSLAPYMMSEDLFQKVKEYGFSDHTLARLLGTDESTIRKIRKEKGIIAAYKMVDTCAAEFEAYTPYLYSTYERPFYFIDSEKNITLESEARPTDNKKVVILGSGPNRIGQGIEFDYCCVHAVFGLREIGYETIMVNCNPETVSTDYDTADRLYFEPLTLEDVLSIVEHEQPEGVIVQFGGQTPLKLAVPLEREGVTILGTSPDAIDRAEDRERFRELLNKLSLKQPLSGIALSINDSLAIARDIGYPVLVRPSYVLGGRAMEIVYDERRLRSYMKNVVKVSPDHPILIDRYLEDAIEVDVDAVSDGQNVLIGGVMEHIEEAGIHSGDSACSLPPYSLAEPIIEEIKRQTVMLAQELHVIGLINIQFAVKDKEIFILEVNPRASRTVPFVSKTTGVPLAKIAAKVMAGKSLKEFDIPSNSHLPHTAVKEAVFPFDRFPEVDTLLGPEMKSTGEVMGIDHNFGCAYFKAQESSNNTIPSSGKVFISVKMKDRPAILIIARELAALEFSIISTPGTARFLRNAGINVEVVSKVGEGRPDIVDKIKNREVSFIINTVFGTKAQKDSLDIRRNALNYKVTYTTTVAGARSMVHAMKAAMNKDMTVKSLQKYHQSLTVVKDKEKN
jgi:carbamoyl-phosphate synthase large subunit